MADAVPTAPGSGIAQLGHERYNKGPCSLEPHPSLKVVTLTLASCFRVYKSQQDEYSRLADEVGAVFFNFFFPLFSFF